jgi:hypothetical protein
MELSVLESTAGERFAPADRQLDTHKSGGSEMDETATAVDCVYAREKGRDYD